MRRILVISLLVLLAATFVVVVLAIRAIFWFGPRLEERDYASELHDKALAASGVTSDEGATGWAAYQSFVEIAYEAPSQTGSVWGALSDDGGVALARHLESTGAIDALNQLADAPPAVRPRRDVALPRERTDDPLFVVDLVVALGAMLRDHALAGNPAKAVHLSRCMGILASTLQRQASIETFTLGLFAELKLIHEIRAMLLEIVARGEAPSVELCEGFAAVLADSATRSRFLIALEGECLHAMGMLAVLPQKEGLQLRAVSAGAQGHLVNSAYRDAIAFARRRPPDRWAESCPQPKLNSRDAIAASLLLGFQGRVHRVDLVELECHATLLMLHIERHIAIHSAPPASLDDLDLAPEALHDPWSGKPYGYRILTDDPHGRPYLLWAVGVNGADDGGAEHPDGNDWALSDSESPADWIVNAPRPAPEG